jgi:pilus assembly protein CpaB
MKSLILIFIALGCGLVASIGISQVMSRGGAGGGDVEMEQILVALADIDIGSKLDAQNVKLEDWPRNKVPEGSIRQFEEVKDKFANARFFKGEAIHVNKITGQLGNISTKVPLGYRAVPVKVEDDTVMKAISPGDRVDVMVFLRRNLPDIPQTGAFTILKNVRVFAINTNTERASDAKGETTSFKTVSVLVKPDHARELAVASQMGKIMLTLRRPDETDEDQGEEVTPIGDILRGGAKVASDAPASGGDGGGGFLGFVKSAVSAQPPTGTVTTAAGPAWSMVLMGPNGTQQFDWADPKGLPIPSSTNALPVSSEPAGSSNQNRPGAPSGPEGQNLDDPSNSSAGGGLPKD